MAFIVDNMLEDISTHGYTTDELKQAVSDLLEPFFESKEKLNKYAMDSTILEMFSFLVRYNPSSSFPQHILDVITCYRDAYSKNPNKVKEIIFSTVNLMGQKENLMWTVKSNTPSINSNDISEVTYAYMKHIGDVLEISTRVEVTELYAILEVSLGKKNTDYENIRNRDFGVIVQSIIDKNHFQNILTTLPNSIKLSDWRNIAHHHTYEINGKIIRCFYGKKGHYFDITLEELIKYTSDVIKSANIIDIARRMFLIDKSEIILELEDEYIQVHDRDVMKVGQLRTAFLGQGFKLIYEKIDSKCAEIVLQDLKSTNVSSNDFRLQRQIHCTQFLYNLWLAFPSYRVCIIYADSLGKKLYRYSVDGHICKRISEKSMNFNEIIKYIKTEKL